MQLLSHLFTRKAPVERRVQTVAITADALLGLFQLDGTRTLRMEGVPEDAKVEAMWVEPNTRTLVIAIASAEFALVTEGTIPPPIYVTIYVTEQVPQQVLAESQ
ncbi:hypothetical protein LCGC14_0725970 [marine sediment metagenome]|uniref:Uncharacterized protein n=1 Tax=marine sediment metagenome TaxID=412755 RepID=A0A0F9QW00_9ZZZZ